MTLSMAIKERVRTLCYERDWSFSDLARKSDLAKSTIGSLMNNPTQCVSMTVLVRITLAFNMSLSEFFDTDLFVDVKLY